MRRALQDDAVRHGENVTALTQYEFHQIEYARQWIANPKSDYHTARATYLVNGTLPQTYANLPTLYPQAPQPQVPQPQVPQISRAASPSTPSRQLSQPTASLQDILASSLTGRKRKIAAIDETDSSSLPLPPGFSKRCASHGSQDPLPTQDLGMTIRSLSPFSLPPPPPEDSQVFNPSACQSTQSSPSLPVPSNGQQPPVTPASPTTYKYVASTIDSHNCGSDGIHSDAETIHPGNDLWDMTVKRERNQGMLLDLVGEYTEDGIERIPYSLFEERLETIGHTASHPVFQGELDHLTSNGVVQIIHEKGVVWINTYPERSLASPSQPNDDSDDHSAAPCGGRPSQCHITYTRARRRH